jgi:stalled ribosome alternative rescue factor ArfA
MKRTRSTVGKGLNLTTRVEKQGKGKGAYSRKKEKFIRLTDYQEGAW